MPHSFSSSLSRRAGALGTVAVLMSSLAACSMFSPAANPRAQAMLSPTKGSAVSGVVSFEQRGSVVWVQAEVNGLKPGQEHGFHVHEKGDCSSGDGLSTGGHFNPNAQPHGPQSAAHHAGDLSALKADANGQAKASFKLEGVSLDGSAPSLVSRGLIIHAGPDDYSTQPTGNAGARIACGVILAR
jgi:Cu-Zn family superoxide dismutase